MDNLDRFPQRARRRTAVLARFSRRSLGQLSPSGAVNPAATYGCDVRVMLDGNCPNNYGHITGRRYGQ